MKKCLKIAHEDIAGIDDSEALDYVARLACPPVANAVPTWPSASREKLATLLLNGARSANANGDHLLASFRLAEALMGSVWTKLYTHGWFKPG